MAEENGLEIIKLLPAVLALLVLLLFAFVFLLNSEVASLKGELAQEKARANSTETSLKSQIALLNQKVNEKDAEIGNLSLSVNQKEFQIFHLSKKLNETEKELNETKAELASKESSLEEAEEKFEDLKDEISQVEDSLDETLQWLSENSHMSAQTEYFIDYSDRKCVDGNDLNLACVALFMDMHLDFVYIDEPNDKLNSIDEMVAKGGGDCEDFSLFLKALINDYETNANLIAWEDGSGKFVIHTTDTREWFYSNADAVNLGKLKNYYPAVFCYVTEYTGYRLEGHCIVALPEKQIKSADDLPNLLGAETFEPQNGRYKGEIGDEFTLCDGGPCGTSPGDSIIVITDSDIYQYIDNKWESIGEQKEKLSEIEELLYQ
jgi:hypothetical protein